MTVNRCINPAAKANASGWGGSASPTRSAALTGLPRTTGVASTGSGFISTPTGVAVAGDTLQVSFYIKNASGSTIAGGKQVFVGFTRSSGGDDFSQSFNTPALGVDGNAQRVTHLCTAAPANATGIYLIIDSLPAGIQVTACMFDPSGTDNPYGDGDTSGWDWDGADGNSSSQTVTIPTDFVTTVYNGTSEVDAAVTVWSGHAELEAAVTDIAT